MIACLGLAALAACASEDGRDAAAQSVYEASFAPEAPDLLIVEVREDEPVRGARLVAPDGSFQEAHAIDTEGGRRDGGGGAIFPSVGVGVGGGSNSGVSTGVGIGFPIFGVGGGNSRSEYKSTARIRVADPAAYRADWQKYELRLTLGDGGAAHEVVIAAPEPPAP